MVGVGSGIGFLGGIAGGQWVEYLIGHAGIFWSGGSIQYFLRADLADFDFDFELEIRGQILSAIL